MWNRYRKQLGAILVAMALVIALALVVNPELRALLLLIDSLGLDLVVLLLATQLRYFSGAVLPAANAALSAVCALALCLASGAIRILPKALPWRPLDRLLCPVLVFMTYGIRCGGADRYPRLTP